MAQERKQPISSTKKVGQVSKQAAKKQAQRPAQKAATRPAGRKPGKSIVNQRQTPWGLIAVVAVLVVFAGAIVAYAVTRHKDAPTNPYAQPEVAAAKNIKGIIWHIEKSHTHVPNQQNTDPHVKYDMSPPIGGNHSSYWADCNGTVYKNQIANENAVHMLEHGAVWITYNPKTATKSDIATLKKKVEGVDRMALSPYADLKTPISLQAWNYQLFVNSASDPRVDAFIDALRANPKSTPENASCSDPTFLQNQDKSTLGNPYNGQ